MIRVAATSFVGMLILSSPAFALCTSYPNTLTNGTTADGGQVMANFNCAALTSGATLNGTTFTGTTIFPGSTVIDSSGNLGVGVTPAFLFDVGGSVAAGPLTGRFRNGSSTGYTSFRLYNDQNNLFRQVEFAYAGSAYSGSLLPGGPAGESAEISTAGAFPLSIGTNNTMRMSITGAGNVGIGTASPQVKLQVLGPTLTSTSETSYQLWLSDTGNSNKALIAGYDLTDDVAIINAVEKSVSWKNLVLQSNGHNVGIGIMSPSYTLHVNGSVAGTSAYNNLSDARLKTNIHPIGGALEIVSKLQGVSFRWRKPEDRSIGKSLNLPISDRQIGFIAQDLRKVLPQAVSVASGKDAIMSVAESKVVPVLVEAVKELKAANDRKTIELGQQASEMRDMHVQLSALKRLVGIKTAQR